MKQLQKALKIFQKLNYRFFAAQVLKAVAEIYRNLNLPERAGKYCDRALILATELDIPCLKDCQVLEE